MKWHQPRTGLHGKKKIDRLQDHIQEPTTYIVQQKEQKAKHEMEKCVIPHIAYMIDDGINNRSAIQ